MHTDPGKVQCIQRWPVPVDAQELRKFLGLATYYRRFVKGFAEIATPLFNLAQKEKVFQWTEPCGEAFQKLKHCLVSAPVLAYPRREGQFILDTDASQHGIGAVLSQVQDGDEKVVAYGSRALTKAEKNYCVTRKELLACVYFMRHFRCYLLGRHFLARSDHAALQWIQSLKEPEGQTARWLEQLQEFDFHLEHRPGKRHLNADALSRLPCHQCGTSHVPLQEHHLGRPVMAVSTSQSWAPAFDLEELRAAQLADPVLRKAVEWLEQGVRPEAKEVATASTELRSFWAQWARLELCQGVLYRRWEEDTTEEETTARDRGSKQLVVPQSLTHDVMQNLHNGPAGCHLGIAKTLAKIRQRFFWYGMSNDVQEWCRMCLDCARRKSPTRAPRAPLVNIKTGNPMERVALDILGPLPSTVRGNKYIVVIADYFTRWTEAFALPNQEAATVAETLVSQWICRFGAPDSIHTDQGPNFESRLFKEVCNLLGIDKTRTTPYHPQSDGLVERMNRTILTMLSIKVAEDDTWDRHLPEILMAYRASTHESTGFTPFRLVFGREIHLPIDVMFGSAHEFDLEVVPYVRELRARMTDAFTMVRERVQAAQQRQKDYYDRRATGGRFKVGDRVWLYSPAVPRGRTPKFHCPWKGPYVVVKVISDVTYRIQLEGQGGRRRRQRIVTHFNRLKPCHTPLTCGPTGHTASNHSVPQPRPGERVEAPGRSPAFIRWEPSLDGTTPVGPGNTEQPDIDVRRGGGTWTGRLRAQVHPPERYTS